MKSGLGGGDVPFLGGALNSSASGDPAAPVLEQLTLTDFRNYTAADIHLGPGIFLVGGENGAGKTNLVEAVFLLGNGRTWRPGGPANLVRTGSAEGLVTGLWSEPGRRQRGGGEGALRTVTTAVRISRGLEYYEEGQRKRVGGLGRRFPVVAFAPDDLALVKGGGEERRDFLDRLGVRVSPSYGKLKRDHERAHRQRTALLKAVRAAGTYRRAGPAEAGGLEAWTAEFAARSADLLVERLRVYLRLRPALEEALAAVDAGGEPRIEYRARLEEVVVADRWEAALAGNAVSVRSEYQNALEARHDDELERGMVLVGPQRDDLEIRLGGLSARDGISQGQQRLVAVALRLAEAAVLEEALGRRPVLVMDDVFSELDRRRRRKVWEFLRPRQGFITSAYEDVGELERPDVTIARIRVAHGTVFAPGLQWAGPRNPGPHFARGGE